MPGRITYIKYEGWEGGLRRVQVNSEQGLESFAEVGQPLGGAGIGRELVPPLWCQALCLCLSYVEHGQPNQLLARQSSTHPHTPWSYRSVSKKHHTLLDAPHIAMLLPYTKISWIFRGFNYNIFATSGEKHSEWQFSD